MVLSTSYYGPQHFMLEPIHNSTHTCIIVNTIAKEVNVYLELLFTMHFTVGSASVNLQ